MLISEFRPQAVKPSLNFFPCAQNTGHLPTLYLLDFLKLYPLSKAGKMLFPP
jgi:hypothetical protein